MIQIKAYKEKKEIKNLFALCFSHGSETISLETFANGSSGCCIASTQKSLFRFLKKKTQTWRSSLSKK